MNVLGYHSPSLYWLQLYSHKIPRYLTRSVQNTTDGMCFFVIAFHFFFLLFFPSADWLTRLCFSTKTVFTVFTKFNLIQLNLITGKSLQWKWNTLNKEVKIKVLSACVTDSTEISFTLMILFRKWMIPKCLFRS